MLSRREIAKAAVMLAVLWLAISLIGRIGDSQASAQTQFVEDAVRNAALTCYAVEGAYPESLEPLRRYYGLAYDEERYAVTYEAFASNQFPEIYVVERGGDAP